MTLLPKSQPVPHPAAAGKGRSWVGQRVGLCHKPQLGVNVGSTFNQLCDLACIASLLSAQCPVCGMEMTVPLRGNQELSEIASRAQKTAWQWEKLSMITVVGWEERMTKGSHFLSCVTAAKQPSRICDGGNQFQVEKARCLQHQSHSSSDGNCVLLTALRLPVAPLETHVWKGFVPF